LLSIAFTLIAIVVAVIVGAAAFTDLPQRLGITQSSADGSQSHDGHDHGDESHGDDAHSGHDHEGHSEANSIHLSSQARANLRLTTIPVSVGSYTQYVEVPGLVTAWPGRTHVAVTSPLTGVINAINVSRGELIKSGTPLFTVRLTHQDLVKTQETFLAQLGQLDVEEKEIERLSSISRSGAVSGKTRLAREYERDKLLAGIRAARQSMLLHGLSEDQIVEIERTRTLIREVVIHAPLVHEDNSLHHDSLGSANDRLANVPSVQVAAMQPPIIDHGHEHIDAEFLVTELDVRRGQSVNAGETLAQLSDYAHLLIEGQAYQRDSELLRRAADTKMDLQAVMDLSGNKIETLRDLKVVYISNEINRESRSLPFYVGLENEIERSEQRGDKRYISWRYKPGQRVTVRLPVSRIDDAIVVPKVAVAEEGPERFLFVENGDHFDRVPVHVLARDSISVAIKNDGQVWPGQTIAVTGAHQLQMALKNQSGGAIDPHAGHNH
jgi:multidrug efflux pump subunit AcrA (membrane-fusion protein)